MYQSTTSVTLKGSSSSLFNNLDILPQEKTTSGAGSSLRNCLYLSVSRHSVNIVQQNNTSLGHKQVCVKEGASSNTATILEAKWCHLVKQVILVLAHTKGVQIFDELGNLLLFWHNNDQGSSTVLKSSFCRGIASLRETVFVGTCEGNILVIEAEEQNCFSLSSTAAAHPAPITTVCSQRLSNNDAKVDVASADDEGSVSMWKFSEAKLKFVGNVTGSRYPCTSLCLLPDGLLAAGFYTGQIRIIDTATCNVMAEIAAHGAALNSIDAAAVLDKKNCCTVVSGGEDTFVRVWKISRTPQLKIRQEWYTSVRDLLICGVKFLDTGAMFGVTGYDSNEVFLYMRTS